MLQVCSVSQVTIISDRCFRESVKGVISKQFRMTCEWMSSPRQIRKEVEKAQSRSGVGEEPKELNIEKAKASFVSVGRL